VQLQYLLLWASGAPNSRAAPGSPHSSNYATGLGPLNCNIRLWLRVAVNTAIASLKIFKNMLSCYVQHQVAVIYPRRKYQLVAAL